MTHFFDINEDLKQNILSDLPKDYSKLEKAILIYKRLCEKLQYSLDYYLEEMKNLNYFRDANNLKFVDGEKNKDVVCFTFNAILSQLLVDAELLNGIDLSFYHVQTNSFPAFHDELTIYIDDKPYYLDATAGVLDNNDLVLSKYSTHKPNGWICGYNAPDEHKQILRKALEKVYAENQSLESNIEKYMNIKKSENKILSLPLETRIQMFLELSKKSDYSIFGFNNLLKFKHLCFDGADFGDVKDHNVVDMKIDLLFAKERQTSEFKAFLFYNPEGYTDDEGYENFDKLQVFEISLKDKTVEVLTRDETYKLFNDFYYVSNTNNKLYPKMAKEGAQNIIYEYEGGRPLYDHHQNPVNVVKKFRKYIKTDKIEELPLE